MINRRTKSRYITVIAVLVSLPLLLSAKHATQEARVSVVAYHTFIGKKNIPTDFSIEELREQMKALREKGLRIVTIDDVVNGRVAGNRNVMITVDDGNKSVYRAYREVFEPLGIKPMLAIYPNIISRRKYALTWEQLRELERKGCEIAAHGFYHLPLKEKLYRKSKRDFVNEIVKSKKVLEERLNRRIRYFVYPSGETCTEAVRLLQLEGFRCAFTITWGTVKVPLDRNADLYELPRYMLVKENWKSVFALFDKRRDGEEKKHRIKYVRKMMVKNPNQKTDSRHVR